MNILLIGSGGREHALAWKISQSPLCDTLFIAPGNGGTQELGEHIKLDVEDHAGVVALCKLQNIELVVVGPEIPLVDGLADPLRAAGIAVFGVAAKPPAAGKQRKDWPQVVAVKVGEEFANQCTDFLLLANVAHARRFHAFS